MKKLTILAIAVFFTMLGYSQTCTNYAVSIADVQGNVSNDFYSLGPPNGQGTVFSEGPSGPYTRVVWDLGTFVDSGTTVCFQVRINNCSGTTSSNAKYSIWLAPDGVNPHSSIYTLQDSITTSSSTWTTVCVNTVEACRYFKISDDGECSFEVDNITYNGNCGFNEIDGYVWEDINYDQNIGGSEVKASNKKVFLYHDLDKDEVIDINEANAIDSTLTNAAGFYSFSRPFDDSMSYVVRKIQSSSDDADEISGVASISNSNADFSTENSGFRFTNISIPKNSIIQKAYLAFTAANTTTGNTNCTIKGHDVSNSSAFSSVTNGISGRSTTTDSVNWAVQSFTQDNGYTTADVSNIIQEIVDRSDWSNGNALSLLFFGGGGGSKSAYMYDVNSQRAPTLVIAYLESTDEYYNVSTNLSSYTESTVMSTDNIESAGFDRSGNLDEDNNFGFTPPNEISGKVFYDKGRNGVKGSNIGQSDVMVYLMENVDSASLVANVNDSVNLAFYSVFEKYNNWRFRVKNEGSSPAMWEVRLLNANYVLDTSNIEYADDFNFIKVNHGDGTYDYSFKGNSQLAAGQQTEIFWWEGSDFAADMNSDGFELEGTVSLDTAFSSGIVTTAVTDANGDYTLYAPYTGGTDTFFITTDHPSYGDQVDLTTSNLQTAIFSEGGNSDPNNDYGFNGTLKITGFVFADDNADGVKQKSEIGEPDVDIYLYEDSNNNDTLEATEMTVLETATTNQRGKYRFKDYFFGDSMSYIVSSELNDYPNDVLQTTDNYEEATFVTFNTVNRHNNFGFVDYNVITGSVFDDIDKDQAYDGGENGTQGVSVFLFSDTDNDGELDVSETTPIDTMITDANGDYSFDCFYTGGTMSYIVNIDTSTLPINTSLTTDNIETASFNGGGNEDNNNDFGHGDITPLPVELTSFQAELEGKDDVLVSWETASELNFAYFNIERRYENELVFWTIGT
ncbi:MAG: hypothetical protein KJP21_02080, partial [Bacteroidia bacterium]|nr:hypothetical protein [Bacteroidia bacterium]